MPFWWNENQYLTDYPDVLHNAQQQFTDKLNNWFPSGWDHFDTSAGRANTVVPSEFPFADPTLRYRALSWLPGGTPPPAWVTPKSYLGYLMGGTNRLECNQLGDAYTQQQTIDAQNLTRAAVDLPLRPNVLHVNPNTHKWKITGTPVRQVDGHILIVPAGASTLEHVTIPGAGGTQPAIATVPDGMAVSTSPTSVATFAGIGFLLLKLLM